MKNFLLSSFLVLMSLLSFGQNLPLPCYYINGGDTLGVIISVEQANKINNNFELVEKLKSRVISLEKINNDYVLLVEEYEKNKSILLTTIAELENFTKTQREMIVNLEDRYQILSKELNACDEQRRLADEIMKRQKKLIKRKNAALWWVPLTSFLIGGGIGTWIGLSR